MNSRVIENEKMPALFIGHGNPMNAIEENEYTATWREIGQALTKPKAILTVSAHWLTKGTAVTAMERPRTIHDFGGFPQSLFAQRYDAPGAPELAQETKELITKANVVSDFEWGLDHGTWSFLLPMLPQADIPVYQLSIDYHRPLAYHYALAMELKKLRKKGVLVVGSGNIVHNLRTVNFALRSGYEWAEEFDSTIRKFILEGNHDAVLNFQRLGNIAELAVPTVDHYIPLIYSLAVIDKEDPLQFFNTKTDVGSVSMTSFISG